MLCIQPSSSTKMPEPTPLPTEKFAKRFFSPHMCIVLLCLAIACLKLGKQVGWPEILTRRGQAVLYAGDCLAGCLSLFAAWALLGLVFRACSFQWNIRHVLVLMVPMGFAASHEHETYRRRLPSSDNAAKAYATQSFWFQD